MKPAKLRVIFVAGLTPMPTGGTGGQETIARTLLESELSQLVEFLPLSSTMVSIPPPPLWRRAGMAAGRVVQFCRLLPQFDVALIFAADGLSVLEKGLMARIARLFGKGVVLRVSSGYIQTQCERSRMVRRWLRSALDAAHVFCAQGRSWADFYSRFAEAQGKVVEIANGIVVPPVSARADGGLLITFVGQATREKGIFEVAKVFSLLASDYPALRLTIAGGGRDLETLRQQLAGQAAKVDLPGWLSRTEVRSLLAGSTVFVFLSHAEGMPNAVLEAMAAGVPCVMTEVGALADLIVHGTNGYLVAPGDVRSAAEHVRALLTDPALRARVAAAGRASVLAKHDITRVWPAYAKALHRAAYEAGQCRSLVYTAPEFMEL